MRRVAHVALAGLEVDVEVQIGIGRRGIAHQVRRVVGADDEVVDVLVEPFDERVERARARAGRGTGWPARWPTGCRPSARCTASRAPRALRALLPALRLVGGVDRGAHLVEGLDRRRGELARERGEGALPVQAVAEQQQVLLHRLRGERPREGQVREARAREVAEVVAARGIAEHALQPRAPTRSARGGRCRETASARAGRRGARSRSVSTTAYSVFSCSGTMGCRMSVSVCRSYQVIRLSTPSMAPGPRVSGRSSTPSKSVSQRGR